MIEFACECGQTIRVDTRYAGKTGRCPKCGQRIHVPTGTESTKKKSTSIEPHAPPPCQVQTTAIASDEAPTAPLPRRKAHFPQWLIPVVCGSLMLITIFLPWVIFKEPAEKGSPVAGKTVLMSWDVLRTAAGDFRAFMIVSWIVGLASVVLGITLRRLPLALSLTTLGLISMIFQLTGIADITARTIMFTVLMLASLVLGVVASLRIRQGRYISLRFAQSISGGLFALASLISVIMTIIRFSSTSVEKEVMLFFMISFITTLIVGLAHVTVGILLLVHGVVASITSNILSQIARALIIACFGLTSVFHLIIPLLVPSHPWLGTFFADMWASMWFAIVNKILLTLPALTLLCIGSVLAIEGIVKACGGWSTSPVSSATATRAVPARKPEKLQQRLQQLDELLDQGVISRQEHQAARGRLLETL